MRGILFALSFVLFMVGCLFGVDGAIAGTGASTAVLGWGWFAAALAALVLAPDRGISRQMEIEAVSFEAATPQKEVWIETDLSDMDSLDETLDLGHQNIQVETINGWIEEATFEAALEEDSRHFAAWQAAKKSELVAVLDQIEAALWADHLISMPRKNTPWLPPSLNLKPVRI